MKLPRYLPDLISAVVALVAGLGLAVYFHTKWYYGGWMMMFGDPPMENPSYGLFVPLFEALPYVAVGFGAGLIAGFGRPHPVPMLIRGASLFAIFICLSRNTHLAFFAFAPVAAASFLLAAALSLAHFRRSSEP